MAAAVSTRRGAHRVQGGRKQVARHGGGTVRARVRSTRSCQQTPCLFSFGDVLDFGSRALPTGRGCAHGRGCGCRRVHQNCGDSVASGPARQRLYRGRGTFYTVGMWVVGRLLGGTHECVQSLGRMSRSMAAFSAGRPNASHPIGCTTLRLHMDARRVRHRPNPCKSNAFRPTATARHAHGADDGAPILTQGEG